MMMRSFTPAFCLTLLLSLSTIGLWSCEPQPDPSQSEEGEALADTTPNTDEAPIIVDFNEDNFEETDVSEYIIRKNRFGSLGLGQPCSDLRNIYPANLMVDTFFYEEGTAYDMTHLLNPETNELQFEVQFESGESCFIDRLTCFDPHFKTDNGLGVGSTFAEVQAANGIQGIFAGGQTLLVYTPDFENIAFMLPYEEGMENYPGAEFEPDEINPDQKVIGVYGFYLAEE